MVSRSPSGRDCSRTVHLSRDADREAASRAAECGMGVEDYLARLIERSMLAAATDAALAPVRQEVAGRGISEEELEAMFDQLRDKVWRERGAGT